MDVYIVDKNNVFLIELIYNTILAPIDLTQPKPSNLKNYFLKTGFIVISLVVNTAATIRNTSKIFILDESLIFYIF